VELNLLQLAGGSKAFGWRKPFIGNKRRDFQWIRPA
jgi:hypothetical protein